MATFPSKPSYTHGSTGTEPSSSLDYATGDSLNANNFDYYLYTEFSYIKDIIDTLNAIDSNQDAVVDKADYANDSDASTYKGNDIDSNGDGIVDQAVDANNLGGQSPSNYELNVADDGSIVLSNVPEINFGANISVTDDGDGTVTVDGSSSNDTHTDVSDNGSVVVSDVDDINFGSSVSVTDDGDGTVTVTADDNATSYKGNDIDSNGDGKVDSADTSDETKSIETRGSDPASPAEGRIWIIT